MQYKITLHISIFPNKSGGGRNSKTFVSFTDNYTLHKEKIILKKKKLIHKPMQVILPENLNPVFNTPAHLDLIYIHL